MGEKNHTVEDRKVVSFFSYRGLVTLRTNTSPILDDVAPTSTGGVINAAILCDALERPLEL